ncbi:WD40 repeat domain-containing protein, partial [Candidatus Poribacteria bacterium]|nr:WD40 repeat domain-containing protein [Candidatus Poribacteria bacterium]
LLDFNDNKVISRLEGHSADITCLAYSNDGKILASGDANKEIIVWDIEKQKERIRLKRHRNTINALAFAPEGTPIYGMCLASGSADGTIRFWDPNIDKELVTFASGHNQWIKAIAFDKNGSTLVSANYDGTVDYWSMKSYREIASFIEGECDYASDVAFSSDATRFACQGLNGYKVIFNHGRFGYTLQAVDDNVPNAVKVWSLPTEEELTGPWNKTTSDKLTFSQTNQIFAVHKSNKISGWNLETGNELINIETENTRSIQDIKFSPDGKLLALHGSEYKLIVWNLMTPNPSPIIPKQKSNKYAFSPDGKTLAILSHDFSNFDSVKISLRGINSLLDTKPKIITAKLQGFKHRMIFSPDSTILVATGSKYNEIILINVDSSEEIARLSGHTELIESFVFSHDGKMLASCSHDGTVLLWDWEKITE